MTKGWKTRVRPVLAEVIDASHVGFLENFDGGKAIVFKNTPKSSRRKKFLVTVEEVERCQTRWS